MMEVGSILSLLDVEFYNSCVRGMLISGRTQDCVSIASLFNVSVRTCQRFFTEAAERRNLITLDGVGRQVGGARDTLDSRINLAVLLCGGFTQQRQFHGRCSIHVRRFNTLGDAFLYANGFVTRSIDPFLSRAWDSVSISFDVTSNLWNVRVEICRPARNESSR